MLELAERVLTRLAGAQGRPVPSLSPDALAALRAHPFPGNVRELENALERAVILCEGGEITPDLLALGTADREPPEALEEESSSLVEYFKRFVVEHQGAMSETELARKLGISRKALWERRIRLGLPRPR